MKDVHPMTLNLLLNRLLYELKTYKPLKSLRYAITVCLVALLFITEAQVTTVPLTENRILKEFHAAHPNYQWNAELRNKWGQKDTLGLPFFDDFATSIRYPDSSKWLNNQVYVNNHFPEHPPTLNVATFDVLDPFGIPYNNTINKDFKSAGDSLISQPINLKDSSGTPYALSDSIVLSFFYQPNGRGYHLNGEDSLRVYFKADNNVWIKVWSIGGVAESVDFEHIAIPITNQNYLHEDFQFMFTTYTRQVGNANHWHIDYVYLDANRSVLNNAYNDYAIQSEPSSLLKGLNAMPYDHFLTNPSAFTADSVYVWASNLYSNDKNIEIRHEASFQGSSLTSTSFSTNANNILKQSSSERRLPKYSIAGLNGTAPIIINRMVEIRERGILNEYKDNDVVETTQEFYDFYAYDDGTAERGFGFDHNTNPSNIPGEIALQYNVAKEDTLYAIGTYFNEAVFDVSSRRFNYRIWKSLEGVNGSAVDSIIYQSGELTPQYNSANNQRSFSAHYIDTLLIFQPGTYYIGWYQSSMYNLNVGWDMNKGRARNPNTPHDKLFYRVLGGWTNSGVPNGSLMMRPYFGSKRNLFAGVPQITKSNAPGMYPNPASGRIYLSEAASELAVIGMDGQVVLQVENVEEVDVSALTDGLYFVRITNALGEIFTQKLIIFAN